MILPQHLQESVISKIRDTNDPVSIDSIEQIQVVEGQPLTIKISGKDTTLVIPNKKEFVTKEDLEALKNNIEMDYKSDRGGLAFAAEKYKGNPAEEAKVTGFLHRITQFFSGVLQNKDKEVRVHENQAAGYVLRVAKDVMKPRIALENQLIEALSNKKRVAIVGAPGSGKTSLLRNVLP